MLDIYRALCKAPPLTAMAMEEAITAGTSPGLLSGYSYDLGEVTPYIQQRDSMTFAPQTGGPFNATNQFIRFVIADGSSMTLMDLSSVRLAFTLKNTDAAKKITLRGDPSALFSRARLFVKGTLVEDIMYYGRSVNLLNLLASKNKRLDDAIEMPDTSTAPTDYSILGNGSRRFVMPLHLGYLQQPKLHYMGAGAITLELQMAPAAVAIVDGTCPYQLENVSILGDIVRASSDVADAYARTLLAGESLTVAMSSWQTMAMEVQPNDTTFSVSISRAFTRLKAVYITFGMTADQADEANNFYMWGWKAADGTNTAADVINEDRDTLEIHAQLGARTYPSLPMRGSAEHFYHLRRTLGMCMAGDTNIESRYRYLKDQFVTAINLEKAKSGNGSSASFSGESSQTGEVLRINLRNLPGVAGGGRTINPRYVYVHLHHDGIVEMRGDGCIVLS